MKELIKGILILAKAIFSDEKVKKENKRIGLSNFFTNVFSIKKEDLLLEVGFDWSGRSYNDDRDLYRYTLIVIPEYWDSSKCIRLMYDIKKDLFRYQLVYTKSGASRKYDNEDMLHHIHNVLERIAKEREI